MKPEQNASAEKIRHHPAAFDHWPKVHVHQRAYLAKPVPEPNLSHI